MGLSPLMVKEVFEIIDSPKSARSTILPVEQNARMALKSAERGYVLENGLVVFDEDAANPEVGSLAREAYLGG
jgi:branched-chain amino acid transport system ATP-binding protein